MTQYKCTPMLFYKNTPKPLQSQPIRDIIRLNIYLSGNKKMKNILSASPLFKNLSDSSLNDALHFFDAKQKHFEKGGFICRLGDIVPRFGLVLSGAVHAFRDDINGNRMILANVAPGGTFGESLCYLGCESQVYITAVTDSEILMLSVDNLKDTNALSTPIGIEMSARFTSMLAERALSMNDRIQILSRITIREKINAFLAQFAHRNKKTSFDIPFDRATMAFYLGTDRSALSRELGRMRDEGLIEFSGNRFKILK